MRDDTAAKLRERDGSEANSHGEWKSIGCGGDDGGPWRVVRTGARREKIVARHCRAAGITCFLPLERVARDYAGVTCFVEVPLLAGCLFARAAEAALRAADASGSIRAVSDVAQTAIGWQLRSLARALDRHAPLEPEPRLCNGHRVEVRAGALVGVQGLVQDPVGTRRLVLQVDALGVAFSTSVEGVALAPVAS